MPKRKSNEAAAFQLWSQSVCAEYYIILGPMFEYFLGDRPGPWAWGNTPGQPLMHLISLRHWALRWARELALTPAMVKRYLQREVHEEYIKPVLFLLSDKEAGDE